EAWSRLRQRLSWKYPFSPATHTPAKSSVTALRRRAATQMEEDIIGAQRSLSPKSDRALRVPRAKGSAADIGSAHHTFLQFVSLEHAGSIGQLREEAKRLEQAQALTIAELALLDFEALTAFWSSELGKKIR